MKCPIDNTDLVMSERSGIEIDYCPQCRGVWLDRGELDKIIERNENAAPTTAHHAPTQPSHAPAQQYDPRYHKKHRKESFLGEIFDF